MMGILVVKRLTRSLIIFSILTFENLNIRIYAAQNISLLKTPFEKFKSLCRLSEFFSTLLYIYVIGINSFAHFQLRASNSEKVNTLKKEETLFESNRKLGNMKVDKIKI